MQLINLPQCIGWDDYKQVGSKRKVFIDCGKKETLQNPYDYAKIVEQLGVGEIYLNSIDLDGTMSGYDLDIIQKISDNISIPVISRRICNSFI